MAKLLKAISPNCCIPKAIPKCSSHLLEKEKQRKILETITGGLICPKKHHTTFLTKILLIIYA
jgi:hypothetical protein